MSGNEDILKSGTDSHTHERERSERAKRLQRRLSIIGSVAAAAIIGLITPVIIPQPLTQEVTTPSSMESVARNMADYAFQLYELYGTIDLPKGASADSTAILSWVQRTKNGHYDISVRTKVERLLDGAYIPNPSDPQGISIDWVSTDPFSNFGMLVTAQRYSYYKGDPWGWNYDTGLPGVDEFGNGFSQTGQNTISEVPFQVVVGTLALFDLATCQKRPPIPRELLYPSIPSVYDSYIDNVQLPQLQLGCPASQAPAIRPTLSTPHTN